MFNSQCGCRRWQYPLPFTSSSHGRLLFYLVACTYTTIYVPLLQSCFVLLVEYGIGASVLTPRPYSITSVYYLPYHSLSLYQVFPSVFQHYSTQNHSHISHGTSDCFLILAMVSCVVSAQKRISAQTCVVRVCVRSIMCSLVRRPALHRNTDCDYRKAANRNTNESIPLTVPWATIEVTAPLSP